MDQPWENDRRWGLGGKAKPMAFGLVLLCAATFASADDRLPGHLQALFDQHKTAYESLRAQAWAETSQRFGLSADDGSNREQFFRLLFFHELFKGAGAAYPNRMAASRSERRRVRSIRVGPKAADRLEELVKTYLRRQAGAAGGQGP